jgi:hypothetical protein
MLTRQPNDYLGKLNRPPFLVVPFDSRAAFECAQYLRKYGKLDISKTNPRARIKFDWQIMAIAQVLDVETVYSDDEHIFTYGQRTGISIVRSFDLELDPDERQLDLGLSMTSRAGEDEESSQ